MTNDRGADEAQAAASPRRLPDSDGRVGATVSVGMTLGLGALGMTFAAVLLAYAILRAQSTSWPPSGEAGPPPLWPWPLCATIAAAAGSATLEWARRRVVRAVAAAAAEKEVEMEMGRPLLVSRQVRGALLASAIAGGSFLAIQAGAWAWMARAGFRPDSGVVSSVVYALTVFHALHALAALVLVSPFLMRAAMGRAIRPSSLGAVISFWHLVTVAWVVILLAVFVA